MIKELPEPIAITEDNSVQVIGWVDKRSFVVKILPEMDITANVSETTGVAGTDDSSFYLDSEEEEEENIDYDAEAEFMSLWEWSKENDLTLSQFEELQNRLETFIDFETLEVEGNTPSFNPY